MYSEASRGGCWSQLVSTHHTSCQAAWHACQAHLGGQEHTVLPSRLVPQRSALSLRNHCCPTLHDTVSISKCRQFSPPSCLGAACLSLPLFCSASALCCSSEVMLKKPIYNNSSEILPWGASWTIKWISADPGGDVRGDPGSFLQDGPTQSSQWSPWK